jgi:outer membrane usher protein
MGLRRIGPKLSFGASAIFATRAFRDIAALEGDPVPTRQITADVSYSLGKFGSIGLAWAEVDHPPILVRINPVEPYVFGAPQTPTLVASENDRPAFLPAQTTRLLTASYSVQLLHSAYLYADVFHDFGRNGGGGASIGITIPLGRRSSVNAGVSYQAGSPAYGQIQAQRSAANIGELGYQVYVAEGGSSHDFGQLIYKSPWATLIAGADHFGRDNTYRLEAQGAVSFADMALFASNPVYQSFAVVDTGGVGGVHVQFENRPAGVTNRSGRVLVPDLLSWDVNRIAIDPSDIPVDVQIPYPEQKVRPPDRSGVVVKFPIRRTNGALLVLVDETGHPLPVGSSATLGTTGAATPVGYDGEAFIEGLVQHNQLVVQLPDEARCVVVFDYAPAPGEIPKIGPLTCRKDNR